MKILAIETSCDETAIAVVEAGGTVRKPTFSILANAVASQIELHRTFGGVFPMMAKRENGKNAVPLLAKVLKEAGLEKKTGRSVLTERLAGKIKKALEREHGMSELFLAYVTGIKKPDIDLIAVTSGPGLEPALWVGINFAKALALAWDIPIIPVNHMEGHIVSSIVKTQKKKRGAQSIQQIAFPAISLLVSGGHTELVLAKDWMRYRIIGETQDDAAGEAFDKVARMLGLPYPGGPEISRLAEKGREHPLIKLPRPMISTPDFNFSFSGLKTAVLYLIEKLGRLDEQKKKDIAREFQQAVVDVLTKKTLRAVLKYKAKTLLLGGGVAGNMALRERLLQLQKERADFSLYFPRQDLATDNALMIAIAGYFRFLKRKKKGVAVSSIKANGGMRIG